jgi:small nuclear ribonucleoprotein F
MEEGAFPVNPKPFLQALVGGPVVVRLKWGMEYLGYLISTDDYMNLQLAGAEEFVDGRARGNLGEILIRCNNVLYVRGLVEGDDPFGVGKGVKGSLGEAEEDAGGVKGEGAGDSEMVG